MLEETLMLRVSLILLMGSICLLSRYPSDAIPEGVSRARIAREKASERPCPRATPFARIPQRL